MVLRASLASFSRKLDVIFSTIFVASLNPYVNLNVVCMSLLLNIDLYNRSLHLIAGLIDNHVEKSD